DASEAEGEKTADERLLELLKPLTGNISYSQLPKITVMVAINDGKLISFFYQYEKDFPILKKIVEDAYFGVVQANPPADKIAAKIKVINLKLRTFIDYNFDNTFGESIYDRQLEVFLEERFWEPVCLDCTANSYCPIWKNVKALRHFQVRNQLKKLFAISYLRGLKRSTIRDLRSSLALAITANLSCKDIHAKEELDYNDLYFNQLFESQDDVSIEFQALDPAQKPIPELDSYLHFALKNPDLNSELESFFTPAIHIQGLFTAFASNLTVQTFRRRLYFEANEEKLKATFHSLRTIDTFLPYQHLSSFFSLLNKEIKPEEEEKILSQLLEGISRSDELSAQAIEKLLIQNQSQGKDPKKRIGLLLRLQKARATAQNASLAVCRAFERDRFCIEVVEVSEQQRQFLEVLPTQLNLIFKSNEEYCFRLTLSLDLYELLMNLGSGGLPFSNEYYTLLDELVLFKNNLHRTQSQEVFLIKNEKQVYHVMLEDQKLQIQQIL
ncbi:MAG: hypothetical protein RML72_08235, partial [Bacteroidia bacterium]|nr:hypothetical protein [Bacteroidia bacterium]MDW8158844.1 hypothetical protein [Bacteroidia bacterium]